MTEQQREAFEAEFPVPDGVEWGGTAYRPIDNNPVHWPAAERVNHALIGWRAALSHADGEAQPVDVDAEYEAFCQWCRESGFNLDYRLHTHSGRRVSDGAYIRDENVRRMFRAWRERAAHPAPQVAVPDVPTFEMLIAGEDALARGLKNFPDNMAQVVNNIWEDMHEVAAPTAPAGGPEFYVEHKVPRAAMAYVGVAAPESDEELGAEMERHAKRVIRAAAQLLAQQPVSDPDGLLECFPGDPTLEDLTREGLFHNAAGYSEWYKRQYHKLREHLSAPAPDEREIAALLERIVPRIDPQNPKPLDESEHCCECTLYYERERIHGEIARLRAGKEGE